MSSGAVQGLVFISTSHGKTMAIDKSKMKCNKPRRTPDGPKKFVVKACKDGKEKIVRFGDPDMKIKKSNPKRRKAFRSRHNCKTANDKFTARYWSCKNW